MSSTCSLSSHYFFQVYTISHPILMSKPRHRALGLLHLQPHVILHIHRRANILMLFQLVMTPRLLFQPNWKCFNSC